MVNLPRIGVINKGLFRNFGFYKITYNANILKKAVPIFKGRIGIG